MAWFGWIAFLAWFIFSIVFWKGSRNPRLRGAIIIGTIGLIATAIVAISYR